MTATGIGDWDYTAMLADAARPPFCSADVINRHLAEARATPSPQITLTPHDHAALMKITDAWNAYRIAERRGPTLSPEAVLRNVLETTARLVAPSGER